MGSPSFNSLNAKSIYLSSITALCVFVSRLCELIKRCQTKRTLSMIRMRRSPQQHRCRRLDYLLREPHRLPSQLLALSLRLLRYCHCQMVAEAWQLTTRWSTDLHRYAEEHRRARCLPGGVIESLLRNVRRTSHLPGLGETSNVASHHRRRRCPMV